MKVWKSWILTPLFVLSGCKQYLDVKPDKKLVVPTTLNDAQSILNHHLFNTIYPFAGEAASDDFFLKTEDWMAATTVAERNAYIWSDDVFNEYARNDWSLTYEKIYYANLVIDGITEGTIDGSFPNVKNDIMGQALFFRSNSFYQLLQIFSVPWNKETASTDLGIPLRTTPDFNVLFKRASVEQSYQQVINDLKLSAELLNEHAGGKTRPTKKAAYALLARIYLSMMDYDHALAYAEKALGHDSWLLDYNTLNASSAFPFPIFNAEVIWHSTLNTPRIFYAPVLKVSANVKNMLGEGDLRTSLFFMTNSDNTVSFKGSYNSSFVLFNGLAFDEMYLTKAECLMRAGKENEALEVLNYLRMRRYSAGSEIFKEQLPKDVLVEIMEERRKQLLFRGVRWSDLRRLNKDPKFAVTIKRELNGINYVLNPNDRRYVFKIPLDVVLLSGIEQN